ncbi:hypothetical protein KEM52_002923, partial [Ascosphaera acerosa]
MVFADRWHMLPLGHAVVLVVFCGGGLGFVGWVKQRMADPLVNTACSLASLAMITVLTKEGDVQAGDLSFEPIVRVLKMLFLGVTITNVVCLAIFPQSARVKLRQATVDLTGSLADMLAVITEGFVSVTPPPQHPGDDDADADADAAATTITTDPFEREAYLAASRRNKAAYTQAEKLLKEAKFEHFFAGHERQYRLEKSLVRCVQDLAQSVGGLRAAASLQFELLRQARQADGSAAHARPVSAQQQGGTSRRLIPLSSTYRSRYYGGNAGGATQPIFAHSQVMGSPQALLRLGTLSSAAGGEADADADAEADLDALADD